ncbi:hypothetical protein Bca52824_015160 [Brassica carinata]|uniref:Pre-SET domain-containing protein n=1 Tax=Brassica carinata TaxID=52824 RepID=A0A8X7W2R6_BRACI|nr:hypothetical protein Bca52824_015160 [Brassica carinata]
MCLVGLHMPMVAGIDYLTIKDGATEGPLATSVVTSGHYNDETQDLQTLIYTGHGGQATDQKLEEETLCWKQIFHMEPNLPIPLVNEIDENDKEMPQDFSYVKSSACSSMMIVQNYQSTACINCQVQLCEDSKCICVQRNGGELPYLNRILVCRKPMVYECGDACPCPPDCHNRVTQTGLKIRVEVFKTEKCGWGLRSLEPIRAGTFICELVGMAKRIHGVGEDANICLILLVYNQFKWNYEPELVGENCWDQVSEAYKLRWRMLVSSKEYGNVSRFLVMVIVGF